MLLCLSTLVTTVLFQFDQMMIMRGRAHSEKLSELNAAMSFAIPVLIVSIALGAWFSLALYSLHVEMRERENREIRSHASAPIGLMV